MTLADRIRGAIALNVVKLRAVAVRLRHEPGADWLTLYLRWDWLREPARRVWGVMALLPIGFVALLGTIIWHAQTP